ncbi:hypothetical protein C8J57DRAFT_1240557 [Mycena rebaudengoi]|nr:hypothetical protein C8J57DRAFT_1240557 [Mycena rebaudengoi]
MSQRHQLGRRKCKELGLETYSPRLSQAQLLENHRQSVRKHYVRYGSLLNGQTCANEQRYWRNADTIREKRRIQMAEKKYTSNSRLYTSRLTTIFSRREKQLKRRRWDPAKKTTPHALPESEPPTTAQLKPTGSTVEKLEHARFNVKAISDRSREPDTHISNASASPRTAESRSPEELAAIRGLVLLGQPAVVDNEATFLSTQDSVVRTTINRSFHGNSASRVPEGHSEGSFLPVDTGILAPDENHGRGPLHPLSLTLMPELQMEHTIYAGALSRVQAAQLAVAKLNSGALTAPTEDDRASWNVRRIRRLRIIKESVLPEQENLKIRGWTVDVDDALGNHLYWELDSEEETECQRAEEECRRALNQRMTRRVPIRLGLIHLFILAETIYLNYPIRLKELRSEVFGEK